MIDEIKNKKKGFLKLIIIIVIALLLIRYYNISVTDVVDWFKSLSVSKIVAWLKEFFNRIF